MVFGTSGHRGSSFDGAFNEWHILAITQAICDYRKIQKIEGPLFLGIDTHALSEPAFASALEVLAANRIEVMLSEGTRVHANPGRLPCDSGLQQRTGNTALPTASLSHLLTIRPMTAASSTILHKEDQPIRTQLHGSNRKPTNFSGLAAGRQTNAVRASTSSFDDT